jgi:hypothetical protein
MSPTLLPLGSFPGGMLWILLAYLLLALFSPALRRAPAVLCARLAHALCLWRILHRPWRVAWHQARRRVH